MAEACGSELQSCGHPRSAVREGHDMPPYCTECGPSWPWWALKDVRAALENLRYEDEVAHRLSDAVEMLEGARRILEGEVGGG